VAKYCEAFLIKLSLKVYWSHKANLKFREFW